MKNFQWLAIVFYICFCTISSLLLQTNAFFPIILIIQLLIWVIILAKWQNYQNHLFVEWVKQGAKQKTEHYKKLATGWRNSADYIRRLLRQLNRTNQDNLQQINRLFDGIQTSPNGVLLLDSEKRIEWCNSQSCIYFGLDQERDIKQHITHLIREPLFVTYLEKQDYSESLKIPYGTEDRKLEIIIRPYGKGQLLVLAIDITQMERMEKMRKNFVADVSHEIRTPLTVLLGFIESIQTLSLTEEQKTRYLGLMQQQAKRMQILVDDLLTLAKLEDSNLPTMEQWVTSSSIMEQTENMLREVSQGNHNITFNNTVEVKIAGSESELVSALSNIAINAVRYTKAGGDITVAVELLTDGSLVFKVQDTGQGIAQEHINQLTQRFYRVDRSRSRDTGGTGLGLSIVKHVLIRHGGYLSIESTEGKGSIFTLHLPKERVKF